MDELVSLALIDIQKHLAAAKNGGGIDAFTGEQLAKFVNRKKPWGRAQINAVKNGLQPAPPELKHAIFAFAYSIDGVDTLYAQSRPVNVQALGSVSPGALILADDRVCEYPLCNVRFVPRTPTQRHHSRNCQTKNYKLKARARKHNV